MSLRFGVVILGAGASSRMGRPKLLLPWGNTTVIGHLLAQWRCLKAEEIAVVCAEEDRALREELERLRFPADHRIVNRNPVLGMFSSIQCAARWPHWDKELSHWVVTLGDQPHLKEATLRGILEFAAMNPEKICQPIWSGHRRHPVVFPARAFSGLARSAESNLKSFLDTMPDDRANWVCDDPGLGVDLDYPSDYDRVAHLAASDSTQPRI